MDSGDPCVCRRVLITSKGVIVKLVMMAPLQAAMILFSSFLLSHRLLLLLRFWLPPISTGIMLEEDDAVEEEVEASTGSATAE